MRHGDKKEYQIYKKKGLSFEEFKRILVVMMLRTINT